MRWRKRRSKKTQMVGEPVKMPWRTTNSLLEAVSFIPPAYEEEMTKQKTKSKGVEESEWDKFDKWKEEAENNKNNSNLTVLPIDKGPSPPSPRPPLIAQRRPKSLTLLLGQSFLRGRVNTKKSISLCRALCVIFSFSASTSKFDLSVERPSPFFNFF